MLKWVSTVLGGLSEDEKTMWKALTPKTIRCPRVLRGCMSVGYGVAWESPSAMNAASGSKVSEGINVGVVRSG